MIFGRFFCQVTCGVLAEGLKMVGVALQWDS